MKKKNTPNPKLGKEPFYAIKQKDFGKETMFKIDAHSFKGAFMCHGRKNILISKKTSHDDLELTYSVWQCKICKKEHLDFDQANKLEKFLIFKKVLEDKLISVERTLNYDGKAYFFRFPKELATRIRKNDLVDITLLSPEGNIFLVEIKSGSL